MGIIIIDEDVHCFISFIFSLKMTDAWQTFDFLCQAGTVDKGCSVVFV